MRTTSTHPTFVTGRLHADAYDTMAHTPTVPEVRESYESLATAIVGQWNGLRAAGFRFETTVSAGEVLDPYENSDQMLADADDGILNVFADRGASLPADHPMQASPVAFGADVETAAEGFVTLNDVFRAVHDVMGHWRASRRFGETASFGPVGEYNAWRSHWETLPAKAYLALWCETRGQNAWTNFYADHAELPIKDRPYVDQRAGVPGLPLVSLHRIITPRRR